MRSAPLALVMLLVGTNALAEQPRDLARLHFEVGKREFADGRFEKALVEFQQAYELAPFPQLIFNMGRCHEELHQLEPAIDAFERYLAVSPGDDLVRAHLTELRARLIPKPSATSTDPPRANPAAPVWAAPAPPLAAPPAPKVPLVRRWWLWAAVGGALVTGAALVGAASTWSRPTPPSFPPLTAQ